MAKHASRLSDFQIPRVDGVISEDIALKGGPVAPEVPKPVEPSPELLPPPQNWPEATKWEQTSEHAVFPVRIAPRPAAEPRHAITVRLPVSMHERIRTLIFTSRRSQQDIVEDALNVFLTANRT
jgi:hypothetical protein